MTSSNKTSTVFIGDASKMDLLLDPAVYQTLLADGVGLYGHQMGVFDMVVAGKMSTLTSDFSGSAPGVTELGVDQGIASGTVTVTNTTGAAMTVQLGTLFKTASGQTFQLVALPGQPGVDADHPTSSNGFVSGGTVSAGSYVLAAGQTATWEVEASGFGSSYNLAANAVVSSAVSGLSVTSSSAMSGGSTVWSDPSLSGVGTTANPSFFTHAGGQIYGLYYAQGFVPSEVDVNLPTSYSWTTNDSLVWKDYVDNARSVGLMNVALISPINGLDVDFGDFATSAYYAPLRQAALYGGGIAFDTPPWFINNFAQAWLGVEGRDANDYIGQIESEIRWARSEGLRSSMIISPNASASGSSSVPVWDNNLLADTKALVARLQADNALPTQFVVESYSVAQGNNTTNTASATNPNSLNAVAEYLSTVATVVSTSESGLEVQGQTSVDAAMNGIVASATVGSSGSATPYASMIVARLATATTMTLKVTATPYVVLSDGLATVAADGSSLTVTGTADAIQAALRALSVSSSATTAATGTLSLSLSDAAGTNSGTTALTLAAPAYTISGNSVFVGGSSGTTVSVSDTRLGLSHPYIFGGAANLDYTGATSMVVLNGAGMTGTASITSLGDNTVWLGTAPVLLHPGGYDTLAATPGPGQISNVVIQGGSSSDQVQVYLLGTNGGNDYVTTDGVARTVIQAGNSQLDFTGGNDTIMLNGTDATGCAYITSLGNSVVYGPEHNFMNFTESALTDHVIAGNGPMFIFGTSAVDPTGTTFVSSLDGNGSVTYTGGTKALDLDMTNDTGSANITLASGAADIVIGTGASTIQAGSGTLSLDLTHAVKAVLAVDGSKAGAESILGFNASTAAVTITHALGISTNGGSLVVSLADGKSMTFVGDTDTSHAGITLA